MTKIKELSITRNKDIFQDFLDKGYTVEYQVYKESQEVGNYNVVFKEHNRDSSSSESEVFYYICDGDGYKLYNLEFSSEEALLTFIVYAMTFELDLDELGEDEELYAYHQKQLTGILQYELKTTEGSV